MKRKSILQILAQSRMFSFMTSDEIAMIAAVSRIITCDSGTVVLKRGDEANSMFVIAEGEAEFYLPISNSEKEEILGNGTAGDAFGEVALFSGGLRTACVRANTELRLCEIDGESLFALIERNGNVGLRFLRTLAQHIDVLAGRLATFREA